MEYRIVLSQDEATKLVEQLTIISTSYVKDTYTGTKRIRQDEIGIREKEYITEVKGTIHRFSSECKLNEIEGIWFEFKWTDKISRFEIEFNDINTVPEEFAGRENIKGWNILLNSN